MSASPLPADVLEVIRIAAESPEACRAASLATGEPEPVLVEAARFYLQQVLFRDEADCYRVLGVRPDEPREAARDHMRWLLRWLHPDRNGSWDAVYAKRIVNAWQEVSNGSRANGNSAAAVGTTNGVGRPIQGAYRSKRSSPSFRIPWIARPYEDASKRSRKRIGRVIKAVAVLAAVSLLAWVTAPPSTLQFIAALW